MERIVLPRDTEVVVVSYGGVGTTFLMHFLAQYKKINDPNDNDGFKHKAIPLISLNPNVKFLYIYGNPQLAAISLFRRDFHNPQSKKLQKWGFESVSPIPKDMTLEEYASQGVERFNFRNAFLNWYEKHPTSGPIMFIKYETIFANVPAILEFLGLPSECINNFPENKSRSSSTDNVPEATLKQLNAMYADFEAELSKMNDVEVKEKRNNKSYFTKYLITPYIKAFSEQIAYGCKERLKSSSPKLYVFIKNKIKLYLKNPKL